MGRARNRRRRWTKGRREDLREVRPRFVLICEDGKSAPNYFRDFRLTSAEIIAVGTGFNTLQLVETAIAEWTARELAAGKDQVWVVMDRNSFPQSDYDNAFNSAAANNVSIAYSNECFEVWVFLHFKYSTAQVSRSKLPSILSKISGTRYSKGMEGLYELLLPKQSVAIANAKKLLEEHKQSSSGQRHNWNPSTSIHELVTELNRYL
jgi:hypothetical protein